MNRIRTYIIVFQNIIYINYGRYIFILYWYNDIYNQTQTSTIEKIRDLSFFLIQCEFFIAYNLLSWKKKTHKTKTKKKHLFYRGNDLAAIRHFLPPPPFLRFSLPQNIVPLQGGLIHSQKLIAQRGYSRTSLFWDLVAFE